ncbi:MAG: site-specific DNA-methyltransferase [Pseudomonadota bacterium]
MSQAQAQKMNLASLDIAEDKREQLKLALEHLLPEAVNESGVDFDQLKRALGEWVEPGKERFGLQWPGKADCIKIIQQPSIATLKPCREESINFDDTRNLFIEGDNLEVLKLLQKSYFSKVKMIYIDPPYNTGNEFIYPDKFAETLDTYLEYTGQKDSEGRKFSTNTDAQGRYHSRWLNMMYPRLYLARNLMRDDGVIFISIDDNEAANLKKMCDEIFGEENFIANIIWQKVFSPKNTAQFFSEDHDYILTYAKSKTAWKPELLERSEQSVARYTNPDNDPRGPWMSGAIQARNYYSKGQYEVRSPSGEKYSNPKGTYWRFSEERFHELDKDNRIWWGESGGNVPRLKRFLSEVKQGVVPQTLWFYSDVGHTQEAKEELLDFVEFENTENVLNSVKPSRLIKKALHIATKKDSKDIILDFFSGSASAAQAVLQQNVEDNGNRNFIMVQLPEPLNVEETKVKTIADLGKSRIRNVIARAKEDLGQKLDFEVGVIDLGFKVLKLDRSNFNVWEGSLDKIRDLEQQLELHVDHINDASTPEDILYELLLKSGFSLTTKIEKVKLVGKEAFSIEGGALLICLEKELTTELIDALADANPLQVICLDEGFKGNDQLKANAVQTFKARAQEQESEIVFKTV